MRRTTKGNSHSPPAPTPAGPDPGAAEGPGGLLRAQVQALLRSGLFDPAFYAAAAGEVFPDRRAAARALLTTGMTAGLPPTPLLSLGSLPKPMDKAWRRGQFHKVLEFLSAPEQAEFVTGPLFDSGRYLRTLPAGTDLEGLSPLGHFLTHATPDTPLPLPGADRDRVLTLGDAREALIDHAGLVVAQEHDAIGRDLSYQDAAPLPLDEPVRLWSAGPGGPLVSIITPWRDQHFARETALLIAQEQELQRWELLFVGDEAGPAVMHDGRVRCVRTLPGEDWRNRGLDEAEAPYAAFLTRGHWWRPGYLRSALKRLIGTGRESGYAAVLQHDPEGRSTVQAGYGDLATLRSGGRVDLGALVCSTAAAREVGGFNAALGVGADVDFALKLASRGPTEAFPFIASERLTPAAVMRRSTAAGADGDWLDVLGRAWVDWDRVRADVPQRVPGRLSVVIPTYRDSTMTIDAARTLLATTSLPDVEINILDNGSPFSVAQDLIAAFLGERRVRYRRLPVNLNFAIGCNIGFAQSSGDTVLFLNNDTVSTSDWLPGVVAALDDPSVAGAQPVLLYPDGTVQTAGTVFPADNGLACHFLPNCSIEQAQIVGEMRFSAVTAAAMVMRAVDVARLEGFDAHYVNGMEDVDLCLRALELHPGGFRVIPTSTLTHLEGKTAGRSHRIPQNRVFFWERWNGRVPGPELDLYVRAGFRIERIEYDDVAIPSPRPVLAPAESADLPR